MHDDGLVDLRSDTVTRPTPAMRRAMAEAEVGDDVYGEDPTVNRLEEAYAARVGKDAALFVPSGTMANQLAIRLLTRPGDLVLAGTHQHVVLYESGAAGVNAGIQFSMVDDTAGWFDSGCVAAAVDAAAHHQPRPGLVCAEDTHMPSGGRPWPVERMEALGEAARRSGVPVHLDGARLWHAEVATGATMAERASAATTVMSCLSKGLGAPVGSVLAGPLDVMAEARTARSRLGGGMRQAGVLAAAGLVAMQGVERLADDHRRAGRLAVAVEERWPDAGAHPCPTNIVVWHHDRTEQVVAHLRGEGVLAGTIAPGTLRLVTHADVDDAGIERAVRALASAP